MTYDIAELERLIERAASPNRTMADHFALLNTGAAYLPSLIADYKRMREGLEDIEGKCADSIGGRINYRAGDIQDIARAALKKETP